MLAAWVYLSVGAATMTSIEKAKSDKRALCRTIEKALREFHVESGGLIVEAIDVELTDIRAMAEDEPSFDHRVTVTVRL